VSEPEPRLRRGGIFEPEVDEARRQLLERLPKAPPEPTVRWTPLGMLGVALLATIGIGLIVVSALGLPLALIGGKVAIVLPIVAIVLLLRGRR
jgi:hypothetical protein